MPQPLLVQVDAQRLKYDNDDDDIKFNFDDIISTTPTDDNNFNLTFHNGAICPIWEAASYPMLKFSLVILTVGCIVPHKYHLSSLSFRLLFTVGSGVHLVWGLQICSPDILFWNSLFFAVNLLHCSYLLVRLIPSRLSREHKIIYNQLFKIYKTDKAMFQVFAKASKITEYPEGDVYACEQLTTAGMKLSLLISGRIVVSYRGSFLYDIKPYEFVDGHEWIWRCHSEEYLDPRFQVTLTASENCRLLTWTSNKLEKIAETLPEISNILHQIVSKNSLEQLYSVVEKKNHDEIITTKLFTVSSHEAVNSI